MPVASVPFRQWVPPRNRPAAGRSGLCLRNHLASPVRTARVWLHPRNLLAQCGVTADTLLPVPTRPWPEGLSGPHNSARFHAILPRPGRARNASRDLCGITNLFFKTGGKKKSLSAFHQRRCSLVRSLWCQGRRLICSSFICSWGQLWGRTWARWAGVIREGARCVAVEHKL